MTNTFFDQASTPEPYRGGFEICPRCVTITPIAYHERHDEECVKRHRAVQRMIELDRNPSPGLVVDDVTEWDDEDPTA